MLNVQEIHPEKGICLMLISAEKTCLLDLGHLYSKDNAVKGVKEALGGRKLDYILLSHSHYDHVAPLSYFRDEFPEAVVLGSEKCAYVLSRDGARSFMEKMSYDACRLNMGEDYECPKWKTEGFSVDVILHEGDVIDLGSEKLEVIEAPGHTTCSLAFYNPTNKIMFSAETTGCAVNDSFINAPFLTSYKDTMDSIDKCAKYDIKTLYTPHNGIETRFNAAEFFKAAKRDAEWLKDFIIELADKGLNIDEMYKECEKEIFVGKKFAENKQPLNAFTANMYPMINTIKKEFPEHFEE